MTEFKYFTWDEFACNCGACQNKIDHSLVEDLDRIRDNLQEPMVITSGYRCESYNREVGGVEGSAHTKGLAVDIACNTSQMRYKLLSELLGHFYRIGIAKDFIHADRDPTKPQGVIWTY